MTERKHFKRLVRARAARTGESYSTARRQIVGPDLSPDTPFPNHFPGTMPVPAALRVLLTAAGLRHPGTGAPFSEAMAFGFSGGIGAGMFAFHYAKEKFSSFYVAGRHQWWDDAHWGQGALNRLGLAFVVKESSGVKPAEKHLRELLAGGRPVMAWVDSTSLPYRTSPGTPSGGGYHAIAVLGIDDGNSTATVSDLAVEPFVLPLSDLAAARGRIKKFKNRLLAIEPPAGMAPLDRVVRESIAACVEALTTCQMKNFRLESLATWADKLDGSRAADSWEKIFPPGPLLYQGLRSIVECIEFHGTGGGLCRPMFAEFLRESGKALGDRELLAVSAGYAELGRDWSDLAQAALPDRIAAFRKTRELLREKWTLFHAKGARAAEGIGDCRKALDETATRVKREFPLSAAESVELRRGLKGRVAAIHDKEQAGLEALRGWVG